MPTETIVAVFQSEAEAERAASALVEAGIPRANVGRHAGGALFDDEPAGSGATPGRGGGGMWQWLTGGTHDEAGHGAAYDRSVESGRAVLTVITDEAHADQAVSILNAHDPIDLDEQVGGTGYAGATEPASGEMGASALGATSTAATSGSAIDATAGRPAIPAETARPAAAGVAGDREQTLSLAEEELEVGKRQVDRGTTRIRRYVVERPVEEQIRLRDEAVSVFRRPVTGATVAPDAFTEKTIEMTETDEEAVVSKRAHVVEEVVIQKNVGERVETVRDTVRREEIDVTGPGNRAVEPTPRRE